MKSKVDARALGLFAGGVACAVGCNWISGVSPGTLIAGTGGEGTTGGHGGTTTTTTASSGGGGAGGMTTSATTTTSGGGGAGGMTTSATTSAGGGGSGGMLNPCLDGMKNGDESDVDCGGPLCPACANGKACSTSSDCQSGSCTSSVCGPWLATYQGSVGANEYLYDIAFDSQGHVVTVGTSDDGNLARKALLLKYNADGSPFGAPAWPKALGTGPSFNIARSVAIDGSNDDILVAGAYSGKGDLFGGPGSNCVLKDPGAGYLRAFVARLKGDGSCVKAKSWFAPQHTEATSVAIDPSSGNIFVTGTFQGPPNVQVDFGLGCDPFMTPPNGLHGLFVMKLDNNFSCLALRTFGGQTASDSFSPGNDQRLTIDPTTGDAIVAGTVHGTIEFDGMFLIHPGGGPYLLRMDATTLWTDWVKTYTPNSDGGVGVDSAIDKQGNIFLTGRVSGQPKNFGCGPMQGSLNGSDDLFVVKLDQSGACLWSEAFGGTGVDLPEALELDLDDNPVIAGTFTSDTVDFGDAANPKVITRVSPMGKADGFLLRLDRNGDLVTKLAKPLAWKSFTLSYPENYVAQPNPQLGLALAIRKSTNDAAVVGSFDHSFDFGNGLSTPASADAFDAFTLSFGSLP